jgi:hypothetical protein
MCVWLEPSNWPVRLSNCRQDGVVLAWRSADPELVVQEVGSPVAGKFIVNVSAGKYRTAVVTSEGDIYMWEGWSKPLEAGAASSRSGGPKEASMRPSAVLGKSPDAPRCAPTSEVCAVGFPQSSTLQLLTQLRLPCARSLSS